MLGYRTRSTRSALCLGAASFLSLWSFPGHAQTAGATDKSAAETTASDEGDGEILVTAQRRAERLVDVPISISVIGGDQLDNATGEGLVDQLRRQPGVAVHETYQGGGSQIAIRGVAAGGALFNGSSPVSYYLDSVPFGLVRNAIGPDLNPYDLDRVEILRGPQGTLYGSSSQNGVVRVLTRDADLSDFDFKTRASLSDTKGGSESYRGDAAVNIPIVNDRLAARIVAGYQKSGGWIDRPNRLDANGGELVTLRGKLNAAPTDRLSIGLSAWISRTNFNGPAIGDDAGRHGSLMDEPVDTDFDLFGGKIAYDFPGVTLTSVTGHLRYRNYSLLSLEMLLPVPALSTDLELKSKVFSQEVHLNSNGDGDLRWSVGGSYRKARDSQFQDDYLDGVPANIAPTIQDYKSTSYAVFGELTKVFGSSGFEITGGLRYFHDDVVSNEVSRNANVPPSALVRESAKFSKLTPRVVLTYHPRSNATLYASYAQGFRSGFPQSGGLLALVPTFPSLRPDTLHNFEVGLKGDFLNGLATVEAAAFFIDWKNVQQSLTVPDPNGFFRTALVNVSSASGPGAELGLTVRPARGLNLEFNVSWNGLEVDSPVISRGQTLFDKGERLNISPELTIGGAISYAFDLGASGLTGRATFSTTHTSAIDLRTIAGTLSIGRGDPMTMGQLRFDLEAQKHWTISAFVDNLYNESGTRVRFPFLAAITDWDSQVRPRTIGLQIEYKY